MLPPHSLVLVWEKDTIAALPPSPSACILRGEMYVSLHIRQYVREEGEEYGAERVIGYPSTLLPPPPFLDLCSPVPTDVRPFVGPGERF